MTKVLVIHHDSSIQAILESLANQNHEVRSAGNLAAGIKLMASDKPDVIVVGHDTRKEEGARLLRHLKTNALRIPVVVVVSRGGGVFQQAMMKLGAKAFIEYPVDQTRFDDAIASGLKAAQADRSGPPPITEEELNSNLSMLERRLNQQMRCFAGKNQVFIQSTVLGRRTTKPRIALRCGLRADYGLNRDVFYEFIRDVCCHNPDKCEAVEQFQATRETA